MNIPRLATAYGMTQPQIEEEVVAMTATFGAESMAKEDSAGTQWTVAIGGKDYTITVEAAQ